MAVLSLIIIHFRSCIYKVIFYWKDYCTIDKCKKEKLATKGCSSEVG